MARLDSYFDPNERKYFITPESVELAIAEEKAKASRTDETAPQDSPSFPNHSEERAGRETRREDPAKPEVDASELKALKHDLLDLKITNRAKDMFIEQMKQTMKGFEEERREYVEQLISTNRKVGELEATLLQLKAPAEESQSQEPGDQ